MVVKKDQLRVKKQETVNAFEKFFFIILGSLSLVFLFVTCWILLTGDDVILLNGVSITPRYFCILFYFESFFLRRFITLYNSNHSELEQFTWLSSPAYHF